ncbi:uncharacterized protein LOC121401560 isoform X2 [Xenopus laevis]|uniref:Uncharacterized protein LOC121401560 isoform X2 n=1 Tax=Xenopus laevis TaxID=8355 RepID=A0A8J1MP07_XENLA|nr:uncharacterized protein LOC121401560 isoform X2 [Xenopus laevis]
MGTGGATRGPANRAPQTPLGPGLRGRTSTNDPCSLQGGGAIIEELPGEEDGGREAAPNPEEEGRRGSEHGQTWGAEHFQAPATRGGGSFRFRGNNRPVFEQRNPQRGWGHRGCQQWNGNGFNDMWGADGCNTEYVGYDNNYEFFPAHRQWYNQRMPGWAMGQEFPYWESYRVPSLQFRNREEEESWLQWRRERTQRQEEEAGPSTRKEKEAYPTNTRMQKEDTSTQRPVVATAAREAPMARCGSAVNILVIGHSFIFWAEKHAAGQQLGLPKEHMKLAWQGWRGMRWEQLKGRFYNALHRVNFVHLVIIHTGGNDLTSKKTPALIENMRADLSEMLENRKVGGLAWSDIIQRSNWRGAISPKGVEKARKKVNRAMHKFMCSFGKGIIRHDNIRSKQHQFFREDGVHLSSEGLDLFLGNIGSFIQEWWKSQEV